MTGRNPIDGLIEAAEAKAASLERALAKLQIELATLRKARDAVAEGDTIELLPSGHDKPVVIEGKRGRSLSEGWKRVLAAIAHKGRSDGIGLDQIHALCLANDIEIKRPTLRAQMSNYVKRGYLGRTGQGNFFIALRGLEVAGLQRPPEVSGTPAQTSAPENGGVKGGSSSS